MAKDYQRIGELQVRLEEERAALEADEKGIANTGEQFQRLGRALQAPQWRDQAALAYPSPCEIRRTLGEWPRFEDA